MLLSLRGFYGTSGIKQVQVRIVGLIRERLAPSSGGTRPVFLGLPVATPKNVCTF